MRSLALLLFLANISLLFWQMELLTWLPLQPEQFASLNTKSSPQTIQGLPSLMLLNEQSIANNTVVEPINNNVEVNDITNKKVTINIVNDQEYPKSTKTLDINANNKLLVNDVSDNTLVDKDKPILDHNVEKQIKKTTEVRTCFQAGPYVKMETANIAVDWLENKYNNIVVNVQKQADKKLIGTWVYLPPFKTLEETKRINQYLDKLGIKDHHIVRGKLKNAISLGVYSIPTNAEIRVKELKSKGYNNVKIRKRYKENINHWLNIKMLVNQNNLITSFNKKFRNFTLISVTCESIVL